MSCKSVPQLGSPAAERTLVAMAPSMKGVGASLAPTMTGSCFTVAGLPNIQATRSKDMAAKDKIARSKLSLLTLAKELENVSRSCKVMAIGAGNSARSGATSRPMAPKA